jgi:membrane protein YdbS with pleckstrin-like domain
MRIMFLSPPESEKRPGALVSHWLWMVAALIVLVPLMIFGFAVVIIAAVVLAFLFFFVLPLRRKYRQWRANVSRDGRKNVRVVIRDQF